MLGILQSSYGMATYGSRENTFRNRLINSCAHVRGDDTRIEGCSKSNCGLRHHRLCSKIRWVYC